MGSEDVYKRQLVGCDMIGCPPVPGSTTKRFENTPTITLLQFNMTVDGFSNLNVSDLTNKDLQTWSSFSKAESPGLLMATIHIVVFLMSFSLLWPCWLY